MATTTPLPFGQPTPMATIPPCGTPPAGWKTYLVQPGDTLVQIAEQAGIGVTDLVRANCLTSTDLAIGQRLYIPAPKPCDPPPVGWFAYVIQPGDTLFDLATRAGVSVAEVQAVNCMRTIDLISGERIYLPPLPEPTPTPCVAIPPDDWTQYMVEAGDTLFDLAVARDTTVDGIMRVNCLTSSVIVVGQSLFLPPAPPALVSPAPLALVPPAPPALVSPAPQALQPPTPRALVSPAPRPLVSPAPRPLLPPVLRALLPPALRPLVPPAEVAPTQVGGLPGPGADGPAATSAPPPCHGLGCIGGDSLSPLLLPVGGPNDPSFEPCEPPRGVPWIDVNNDQIRLGERRYFFACEFPSAPISATVTAAGGATQLLKLLSFMPDPELKNGSAQAVMEWLALPWSATGEYTISVWDKAGNTRSIPFWVKSPTDLPSVDPRRVLILPTYGLPGMNFTVYYVGFPLNQKVRFDLYGQAGAVPKASHEGAHMGYWEVDMKTALESAPNLGWARGQLTTARQDPKGLYAITFDGKADTAYFWLR